MEGGETGGRDGSRRKVIEIECNVAQNGKKIFYARVLVEGIILHGYKEGISSNN